MRYTQEFTKGLIAENPLFVQLLGTCPALAVTTSVNNAIGMGVAFTAVLIASNFVISLIKKVVPNEVRIPAYIVVIATFVTLIEMLMHAYVPALYISLGLFIPLIVVNCIILGRAEAFASKNNIRRSILDALGMGTGYTLALILIAGIREILGGGSIMGLSLFGQNFQPMLVMILPPGAFITMGFLFAGIAIIMRKKKGTN
ncbi:MAG: electron transport complex subunit E [Clostridia bacterium]